MAVMTHKTIEREESWIKHYSSAHEILLVGEGDFSFSACLAVAFQSATNIVATSLDSYDELNKKYKRAKANLKLLKYLGASVLHGVDATKMKIFPYLQGRKFHRIIYNFPHAGFHRKEDHPLLIKRHKDLVHGFLRNARRMLCLDGEIHVSHKTTSPFNKWGIEGLALKCSLVLVATDDFRIEDYPGYYNKRGAGTRCDDPFPLGKCKTFKFRITLPPVPMDIKLPLHPVTFNYVQTPNGLTSRLNECLSIFGGYLRHVGETFGNTNVDDVCHSVHNALTYGFQTYLSAFPGRPVSGYVGILEELHNLSIVRSEQLRQMLSRLEQYP